MTSARQPKKPKKSKSGPTKPRGPARGPARGPKPKADVLDRLSSTESAEVLRRLLIAQPSLRERAVEIATAVVADVDAGRVAEELATALTNLDITDLNGRAGRQPWGYMEPTEAAWELLQDTVRPFISNIVRLAGLGHIEAACAAGRGTIAGLHAARASVGDSDLLGWAPDFLDETAAEVLSQLRRALGRQSGKDSMLEQVIAGMEDWPELDALIRRRR